jgi:3'-5' exoribonuclease
MTQQGTIFGGLSPERDGGASIDDEAGKGRGPRKAISEWKKGDRLKTYVRVSGQEQRTRKNGDGYYSATLYDASGSIRATDWDCLLRDHPEAFDAAVRVTIEDYKGDLRAKLQGVRPASADVDAAYGYDPNALVRSSPKSFAAMSESMQLTREKLSPVARELWDAAATLYGDGLVAWPAAMKMHHACRGGLLDHVTGMLDLVRGIHAARPDLDFDVLALGVLFHDIGKIRELGPNPGDPYTAEGLAVGHIVLSRDMWREAWNTIAAADADMGRIADEDVDRLDAIFEHVEHLILSHHGTKENGSPVEPMTAEAIVLHQVDMIDSRLAMIREATESNPTQPTRVWGLGTVVGAWPTTPTPDAPDTKGATE